VDRTKCVNQICGVEAFGCPTPGCDKGGITYRFVEVELKAQLKAQCKAQRLSEDIEFQWILPATSLESASSPVAMLCNGKFDSSTPDMDGDFCNSTQEGNANYYKGPTPTEVFEACTSIDDTDGCVSPGPDMAAGSIQLRIDRMALVQFTAPFLTVPQQVATRVDVVPPFFSDLMGKMALFFGPFTQGLWIAILIEVIVVTLVFLFIESSVNDDIAEGFTSIPDTFYWSFTTVLGGADKAPVSIGGKIVFVAHAIFALIIGATYTGAVAAFLISSSNILTVQDFDSLTTGKFGVAVRGPEFDSSAAEPLFKGAHSGGNSGNQTGPSTQFLQFQALMKASSTTSFSMFTYNRMLTKTPEDNFWEYAKGTSPCKDEKNQLGVYDAVLCGKDGDPESPVALVHDYHSLVYELNRRYRIDGKCKLVTRGVAVNPAGVALAFPQHTDMHIPFSKAILELTRQDKVTAILRLEEFQIGSNKCMAPTVNSAQMTFSETAGLFIIAFGGLGLTVLIGLVERFLFFKNQTAEEGEGEEGAVNTNDDEAVAEPGAADEENVNEEYECITGLLDELNDQMGRIEGLSSKLAGLREKAEAMGALKPHQPAGGEATTGAGQGPSASTGFDWNPLNGFGLESGKS